MKQGNDSVYNSIFLLTQLVGLFPDGSKLVQHVLTEDGDLAGVDHVNHTVNLVIQSHFLPIAGTICTEGSRRTELRNKGSTLLLLTQ